MILLEDFWKEVQTELQNREYWNKKCLETSCGIHLAVMVEPYLSLILKGKKTIESRFSQKKNAPYGRIKTGDIVVMKKSGGGIIAVFEAGEVWTKQLFPNDTVLSELKESFGTRLCLKEEFWERKKEANYVTLIEITHLQKITSIQIEKANRQSWIICKEERE